MSDEVPNRVAVATTLGVQPADLGIVAMYQQQVEGIGANLALARADAATKTFSGTPFLGTDAFHFSSGGSIHVIWCRAFVGFRVWPTCYLKAWLQLLNTPQPSPPGTTSIVDPDFATWEWFPGDNPCIPGSGTVETNIFSDTGGDTDDGYWELHDPDDGSVRALGIKKWSGIVGYDPPDDGSHNGYPAKP